MGSMKRPVRKNQRKRPKIRREVNDLQHYEVLKQVPGEETEVSEGISVPKFMVDVYKIIGDVHSNEKWTLKESQHESSSLEARTPLKKGQSGGVFHPTEVE